MKFYLTSTVPGHEGPCVHTWLNRNQVSNRFDGGVTGFFRRVKLWRGWPLWKTGPEFHGIIFRNRVETTTRTRSAV